MRIVFVTSRFPFPVEKGDKLRAFHQIRYLSERHEIHLVSLSHRRISENDLQAMRPYCKSVRVFYINKYLLPLQLLIGWLEGLPLQISYFLDRTIKRKVQYHIINIEPDHMVCQLIRAAPYVRALPFRKTLDYMDVFSEGMRQRANKATFFSLLFNAEAKRLAAYERSIYKDFDRHIMISAQDRDRLQLPSKEFITIIPNGVDPTFYYSERKTPSYDLVFVGNMGYKPNIDAAYFLADRLLPGLEKKGVRASLLIAGARPARSVRALARHRGVTVRGWLPDIREAYDDGRIFVAPMFSGLGLQNKILEAMSTGLPCVTTSLVNNAIGAKDGEEILIADTLEDMVRHVTFLLKRPEACHRLSVSGRDFVSKHFRWEDHVEKLEEVMITKNEYLRT